MAFGSVGSRQGLQKDKANLVYLLPPVAAAATACLKPACLVDLAIENMVPVQVAVALFGKDG
jgi:hypothetical protein